MRAVFQPPASIVSVVEAPRAVNSLARPTRPEWPVIRPRDTGGLGRGSEAAPEWRVHRLSGERRDEWSVSVSGNWRITFVERNGAIEHLNLEDYH